MGRRRHPRSTFLAAAAAILGLAVLPALTVAHPLGNFTINHYAGLRVEPHRIVLDLVVDQAEVPTFQASRALDLDGDGVVSTSEAAAARLPTCERLLADVRLAVDGVARPLRLTAAGLSLPSGAGGLPTMRSVCVAEAGLEPALDPTRPTRIAFSDEAFAERLGWREIVVVGSGVTVAAGSPGAVLRGTSPSGRLTAYPEDLLAAPLADRTIEVLASAGGPVVPDWSIPDASPVGGPAASVPPAASAPPVVPSAAGAGAIPGGPEGDLPSIFRATDLTPLVVLVSLLTAAALGAGHALTPGHGKTLMAAYLVGTRGTARHAIGLGLSVSLSHTAGILVLAAVVLGAADVLPPDLVVRTAPVVAALGIVVIGGWMLVGEWRRRRAARATSRAHDHAHWPGHGHGHAGDHGHGHGDRAHDPLTHAHGGIRHTHVAAPGSTVTWRSLFALGLAGGLIPSTSALLILLGAIAAGRPAFGLVLVVAFGLGMAAVMGGIGIALVVASGRLSRLPTGGGLARVGAAVPLVAAVLVFGFGVWLTAGALGVAGIV
jgi:nickel/cobalt exporter